MVGCGIIGLEMATVYDALGSKVTMVELLDQLIPGCDPDLVKPLHKRISARYEGIHLGTKVESVEAPRSTSQVTALERREPQVRRCAGRDRPPAQRPGGRRRRRPASTVDDAGFIPVDRQMRTNVPHIYAIGDVVGGPMLAHKASHEGKVAAEVIAGHNVEFDARTIPSVAYTDPEVAWMGLTETEAREQGIEYEKAVFPWAASGRALSLGRDEGMTKLLFEAGVAAACSAPASSG